MNINSHFEQNTLKIIVCETRFYPYLLLLACQPMKLITTYYSNKLIPRCMVLPFAVLLNPLLGLGQKVELRFARMQFVSSHIHLTRVHLFALVTALCASGMALGQMVCLNCEGRDTTRYTNGYPNDSLFFTCQGQTASLKAQVNDGGSGLYNFQWYRFISASNSWQSTILTTQAALSTYTATLGGFRVVATDLQGVVHLDETCWVSRINTPPLINANTLQPGCAQVNLAAVYFPSNITGYYNPPPSNPDLEYLIDGSTEIQICLDIEHPTLTDLSLTLIGPPACGSPSILLTPSQTPLSQDTFCYNSDAVDLCFANFGESNFHLCDLPSASVSGVFGSYGSPAVAIDWSPLVGCVANQNGWQLIVGDCLDGAVGQVTNLSLQISGEGSDGLPVDLTFSPALNLPIAIADNSCSGVDATQIDLTLDPISAHLIPNQFSVSWAASPAIAQVNGATTLNVYLNPGPTEDTYFSIQLVGPNIGTACGAGTSDVEFFDYINPDSTIISLSDEVLCLTDSAILITSSISEGVWSGPVEITDSGALLRPADVGIGEWVVSFHPVSNCIDSSAVTILIDQAPQVVVSSAPVFCSTDDIQTLTASPSGGVWSGDAILDSNGGTFSPAMVNGTTAEVVYTSVGNCPASDTTLVSIEPFVSASIVDLDTTICLTSSAINFESNLSPGSWSGPGISNAVTGIFNPAQAGLGEHTIVYNYAGACESSDEFTLRVEDPSIVFEQPPHVCVNSEPLILTVTATPGIWTGLGIVDEISGLVNPFMLAPGTHYMTYTLDNACASRDSVPLVVEDFPAVQLALPEGICVDDLPIVLQANVAGGLFSGDGVVAANTDQFNPAAAGEGYAVVNYHLEGVCIVDVVDSLVVYPLPNVQAFSDTTICPEGQAILSATGAVSYMWFPGVNITNPLLPLVVVHPDLTMEYMVVGQSEHGCDAQATVTVTVLSSPVVTTNGPLEICLGDSDLLVAEGLNSFEWSGPGLVSPNEAITEVTPTSTSTYTVSGYDSNGCYGESTAEIVVYAPSAYFEASDTIGIPPLLVNFTNLSNADYFIWDLGNGDSIVTTDPAATIATYYNGAETFNVSLTAYLNGCPAYYSNEVITYYDSELIKVPNIVTPNGDGKNDYWEINTQNMDELHADIFNRWGLKVGELVRPDDLWNPKSEGEGTYYYMLHAVGLDEERYNLEGYFTVLQGEK